MDSEIPLRHFISKKVAIYQVFMNGTPFKSWDSINNRKRLERDRERERERCRKSAALGGRNNFLSVVDTLAHHVRTNTHEAPDVRPIRLCPEHLKM